MIQHDIIDRVVSEVLLRMRPRVLVLLTAADGYKTIIRTRLQQCQRFSPVILLADRADQFHTQEEWGQVGPITSWAAMTATCALENIERIFIPFLDFSTLTEIASGLLQSDSAQLVQLALMSGKIIMALDYNCNPTSELNQLKGLSHGGKNDVLMEALPVLAARGIQLCTLDQMLSLQSATRPSTPSYITLSELKQRNGQIPEGARLTDLALEYNRGKNNHKV